MGIEQHLVSLRGVGHQPEHPAAGQLHVSDIQPPATTANNGVLAAPIELERIAHGKVQRHERGAARLRTLVTPASRKGGQTAIAAGIALRLQVLKQLAGRASITLGAMAVGQQPGRQLFSVRVKDAWADTGRIGRFDDTGLPKPASQGVAG